MSRSTVSRRVSEVVGVALFACALIWLIALVSYTPSDPVWFFNTGSAAVPANFAGRVGAFLAELSFQLLGYASYLVPTVLIVVGWHYFWCHALEAAYTKAVGALLLFACLSSFLSLAFGSLEVSGKAFRAGGYLGEWLASELAAYLNRTGSIILILTVLFLAIILSTQFSFGRTFALAGRAIGDRAARLGGAWRAWREEQRRAKQRREVLKKHLDKPGATETAALATAALKASRRQTPKPNAAEDDAEDEPPARPAARAIPMPTIRRAAAAPLPLPDPEPAVRSPAERRKGAFTMPPLALLDAPRSERKIDERELMDGARNLEEKCREFAVEGTVVQIHPGPVVTTYEFKPDAGVKYSEDHRPRRRPVPGDAGRVGVDRAHPGQVHGRHPDPEPQSRRDLAPRAARVRGVPAVRLEDHAGAGQDHPRRAVRERPRHDAPPAHRGLHGHGQVGQRERHADAASCSARRPTRCGSSSSTPSVSSWACTRTSRTC